VAFRGDHTALAASREEIRKHFQVSERQHGPTLNLPHLFQPNLPPNPFQSTKDSAHLGPEEAKKKIEEGVEAESFIRLHVVQAQVNDKGNYEMSVEPQHVDRTMPGEHHRVPRRRRRMLERKERVSDSDGLIYIFPSFNT
jgi:complex III assembly factor LYRM7